MGENRRLVLGGPSLEYLTPEEAANKIAGVYGVTSAGTPKFYTSNNILETNERQARFYIPIYNSRQYHNLLNQKGLSAARRSARAAIFQSRGAFKKIPSRKKSTPDFNEAVKNTEKDWDSANNEFHGYIDFIASTISIQYRELSQISDLLSDSFASYFSGQGAPMMTVSGWLLNTRQNNWLDMFQELYQDVLRGTKAARNNFATHLQVDSHRYVLGVMGLSFSQQSMTETAAQFTLQAVIHENKLISSENGVYSATNMTRLRKFVQTVRATGGNSGVESAIESAKAGASYPAKAEVIGPDATGAQYNLAQANTPSEVIAAAGSFIDAVVGGRQSRSFEAERVRNAQLKAQQNETGAGDINYNEVLGVLGATSTNLPL